MKATANTLVFLCADIIFFLISAFFQAEDLSSSPMMGGLKEGPWKGLVVKAETQACEVYQ